MEKTTLLALTMVLCFTVFSITLADCYVIGRSRDRTQEMAFRRSSSSSSDRYITGRNGRFVGSALDALRTKQKLKIKPADVYDDYEDDEEEEDDENYSNRRYDDDVYDNNDDNDDDDDGTWSAPKRYIFRERNA